MTSTRPTHTTVHGASDSVLRIISARICKSNFVNSRVTTTAPPHPRLTNYGRVLRKKKKICTRAMHVFAICAFIRFTVYNNLNRFGGPHNIIIPFIHSACAYADNNNNNIVTCTRMWCQYTWNLNKVPDYILYIMSRNEKKKRIKNE